MGEVIQGLIILFARHPKLGGLFGLITAIVFGILGLSAWSDARKMPDLPIHTTINQIATTIKTNSEVWVEIERVKWDCTNIVYTDAGTSMKTEVIFTDDSTSILGVALFSGDKQLSCGELNDRNVKGTVSIMMDGFYNRMAGRGFQLANYENSTIRLNLCTFCSRSNSLLLMIISFFMVLLGITVYPLSKYLRKRYPEVGYYEITLSPNYPQKGKDISDQEL
jgi:hypothetical protein